MDKDKEIKLRTLEADIKRIGASLQEAAETIINQDVSNYPVFVAHQHDVEIGIALLDKNLIGSNWSYKATTLEELVAKNIVTMERLEDFKMIYKPPEDFLCVFVADDTGAEFVFYPYPERVKGDAVSDNEVSY